MTENMAARGEGLAGHVERALAFTQTILADLRTYKYKVADSYVVDQLLSIKAQLEMALEAAAPAGTAPAMLSISDVAEGLDAGGFSGSMRQLQSLARALNARLATPSPEAPPATEFDPFTLTVGELLADGIFHRCVESGEFNHALCAKMIDNALAEEKLSNIAATQEPAGSGADIGKVGASIDFRFAGSGAICAQCKANADWNDGAGYHELAEKCRQYCRDGHPCPSKSGSPRKVGEDGALKADDYRLVPVRLVQRFGANVPGNESDTRWTVCLPNGDYAHLFPEYLLSRPSSVPVGEQKQEEGV